MKPFGGRSTSKLPPCPVSLEHHMRSHWPRRSRKRANTVVPMSSSSSGSSSSVGPAMPNCNDKKLPKIVMPNPAKSTVLETTTANGTPVFVFNTNLPRNIHPGQEFYVANSPIVAPPGASCCCSSTYTTNTSASASATSSLSLVRVTCPKNHIPGRQVAIIIPKDSLVATQHHHQAADASSVAASILKDVVMEHRGDLVSSPVPTEIQVDQSEHWDDNILIDDAGRDDCEPHHHEVGAMISSVSNDHQALLESMLPSTADEQQRCGDHHHHETRTHTTARTSAGVAGHYELTVPSSAVPGQTLTVLAGGKRVQVTCPPDAVPGRSKIRF